MEDLFRGKSVINRQDWLNLVAKDLKGGDFNHKLVHTIDGIVVQPLYTRDQLPDFEQDEDDEFDADFLEAVADTAHTGPTWNVAEDLMITADSNLEQKVIEARKRGVNHLRLQVQHDDLWDTVVNDMVKLSKPVNFSFNINSDLMDEDIVSKWRDRVGYLGDRDRVLQAIEFDPVSFWMENEKAENQSLTFTHLNDLFLRLSGHLHDCKLIKVDASFLANKGEDIVSQLTSTLLMTSTYFEQLEKRNVPPEELMHLLTFRFGIGTNFFFEIAKLRAFKILFKNLVKAYSPEMDFIPEPEIQCVTSTHTFTTTDEHSNLLRTTTAAMSAILGGCNTLYVTPFTSTDTSVDALQLAANIQHLLRYESYMDQYRDAANGSFYIEQLTAQFGEKAWQQFINLK